MASDMFLKIDGVPGESQDAKHKDEIDVLSWNAGVSLPVQLDMHKGQGLAPAGRCNFQDFSFTMQASKASPVLMLKCATGEHIPKAVLSARKAGTTQEDYYVHTFTDLLVTSFTTGGAGGGDNTIVEHITMAFSKYEVEFKPQDAKGKLGSPVKTGYDLKAVKKV